jgi:hypothetical protein
MDCDPITKSLFRALLPKMCRHNYAAGLLPKEAGSGMGLRTERVKQNPCPTIAPYGSIAYPLIHKIPKTEKIQPGAHIGYLVGYNSTSIFHISIPSQKKAIRTRDVTFDETLFYDPTAPDISKLLSQKGGCTIGIKVDNSLMYISI